MLYFRLNDKLDVVGVSAAPDLNAPGFKWARDGKGNAGWCNRNDFDVLGIEFAQRIAFSASELLGKLYLAVDKGDHVYPRYDVIEAPAVGDKVSYAFNGDSYPCGEIVKISTGKVWGRRVVTSTGKVFYRRGESANWKEGGWSMIPGHVNERNPSF